MFISKSMTRKVITVRPDDTIITAKEKMSANKIRHLPVVAEDDRLIGIITDRDIRSALPSASFEAAGMASGTETSSAIQIKDVMTKDPISVSPLHTLQDALLLIQQHKFGAFPVVSEDGKLKGIISVRDLLRAFINVLGIGEPGTLLCIIVEEKIGQLKKIVDAITEENISFGSVLVARYWEKGKRAVFPYLLTQNVSRIKEKLVSMGYELLDPMEWYMDSLPINE
jgi:acetoin utilization protein AcuB